MIYETAVFQIKDGHGEAFEAAVAQAVPLFQKAEGALSFRLERRIETPLVYELHVGWTTVEAHTEGFRGSADFPRWRELIGEHLAEAPTAYHTQQVYTGF